MHDSGRRAGATEKRSRPRSPATRKVYVVNGQQAFRCSLIDIAEGGARIAVDTVDGLQDGLILVDTRTRQVHLTRVVWRASREAGLQFIETGRIDQSAGGVAGALDVANDFVRRLNVG